MTALATRCVKNMQELTRLIVLEKQSVPKALLNMFVYETAIYFKQIREVRNSKIKYG